MVTRLLLAAEKQKLAARPFQLLPSMVTPDSPLQVWTQREAAALDGVSADDVLGWALVRTGENGRRQSARSKRPGTKAAGDAGSPTKFSEARAQMRAVQMAPSDPAQPPASPDMFTGAPVMM